MWDLDTESANEPVTDAMIGEAEALLGVRLPPAYIAALRQKNGGSTTGQYIRLPAQKIPSHLAGYVDHGHVSVSGINGIGQSHQSVLRTQYFTDEWGLPKGLVLLAGDGHTWIALDYRASSDDPPVVFVESESGDTLLLAQNFETFFRSLIPHAQLFDHEGEFIGS